MRCRAGIALVSMATAYGHAACIPAACYVVTFNVVECSNVEERGRIVANLRISPTYVREAACEPNAPPLKGDTQRQPPRWDETFQIPFWLGVENRCSALPQTMQKLWRPKCCDIVGRMQECALAPHPLEEVPAWAK